MRNRYSQTRHLFDRQARSITRCSALTACLAALTLSAGMPIFAAPAQAEVKVDTMLSLPPGNGAWVVTMENGSPPFETTSVNSKGEIMVTATPNDPPNFYRCRRTLGLSERIRVKSAIESLRPDKWKIQYGAIAEEDPAVPYALMLRRRIDDKATEYSAVWSEGIESCTNGPGACRPSYMEEPLPPDLVAIRDVLRATATPFHESCSSQQKPAKK